MTQREALNIMKTGTNVFLTGAAGSGKTHVLRQYLDCLRAREIAVGITASTGIAATHMGGITIHAWSGIGIRDYMTEQDIEELAEKDSTRRKIEAAKVLIIDEISMLHHFRLDMVDKITKHIRNNPAPFGGLQVILCGDFFQLPPVSRQGEEPAMFAYHSRSWKEANFITCYLEEQYRQNDQVYLRVLNAMRAADVTDDIIGILRGRMTRLNSKSPSPILPTRLYSHNANVDEENNIELGRLAGQAFEYVMNSAGNKKLIEALKKSCLAPESLKIKKGARIMFVKNNFEKGYANGTLGTVEECGFENILVNTVKGPIKVEREVWRVEDDGRALAEIEQYPLRLAWAITIHKSQGMSLDAAYVDLSRSFEKGMGYVALSRIRSLDGLTLLGLNERALEVHEEALSYDRHFQDLSAQQGADFTMMSDKDMKERHLAFLGPEPEPEADDSKDKFGKAVPEKPEIKKYKEPKTPSSERTRSLISSRMSIKEAAKTRNLTPETIIGHIEEIRASDPRWNISHIKDSISVSRFQKIAAAFNKVGMQEGGQRMLTPVKRILGGGYSFEELRVVRLFL